MAYGETQSHKMANASGQKNLKAAPQISPVMQALSAYIARALRRPLPPAVLEKTKHHLLDTLAAMLSGSRLPPGKKAISFAKTLGGTKEACVAGSRMVTAAANAAFANGMLGHADETDDSHSPSQTHPGCGVVAAAFLRAVALGYDVCCRLTQSLNAVQFRAAGHSTHSFGPTFGAAAAAGALARLDERRVRHLLSYAAQQASGVSCWMRDEEHIEKAFDFGGMPARNGVQAAAMVAHGFTGVEDVFSGERNFFVAYGRSPDPEELARDLGERYEIMNADIKRWAVGSPIQAPLDSLLELIRAQRIRPGEVERVVVRVAHLGANTTDNRHMPDICMQHLCAVMLADGTVTFRSSHDGKRMRERTILELRGRVELVGDDALTRAMPRREGIVEIRLKDGREFRHHTRAVRGTPENPMTREEVEAKSRDLMAPVTGAARSRKLCEAVWSLEDIKDVRMLRPLLRAPSP
jgi:2-methylcitrate dehydratase PrpD